MNYWWCPYCKCEVDPHNVTYEELHDKCGRAVESISNNKTENLDMIREFIKDIDKHARNNDFTNALILTTYCINALVDELDKRLD